MRRNRDRSRFRRLSCSELTPRKSGLNVDSHGPLKATTRDMEAHYLRFPDFETYYSNASRK